MFCGCSGLTCLSSVFHVRQPPNKSPSPANLAHRQHQFIAPLPQWQVDRVVFRVNNAEESRVAEILCASATIENLTIQKHADVVAITDVEFLHLVAVGIDIRPRVHNLHPRLGFEPLRKIVPKRDIQMRGLAVTIEDYKSRRLRLYILPMYAVAL